MEDIITITIPHSLNDKSSLEIAAILLHEGIHAELRRIYEGNNLVPNPLSTQQFNYLVSLCDYYRGESPASLVSNNASHTFMVYNHLQPLANAIMKFDNNAYNLDHYMWFASEGLSIIGKLTLPPFLTLEDQAIYFNLHHISLNDDQKQICEY
ncbi:MAG: hypothetical protein ABI295_02215 [Xanthomarina sp.]